MANDMLRLWEAIEPMAKASVERQTRDSVRMKQMVVTVAYNSTTKTVGVAEPFSDTIQIPVYGGIEPTSLTVGKSVWVMLPYSSMSNAMVFMAGDGSLPGGGASVLEARIAALEASVSGMWETIYPVGSLYISASSTSPQTLFGGTWVQIEDTFLLAAGQTYTAGDTGGEVTHTLIESELPSITGSARFRNVGNDAKSITSASGNFSVANYAASTPTAFAYESGNAQPAQDLTYAFGGGEAHNNMPPYLAVYVWKRTA